MTLRDGLAALLVVTLLGVNFVAIKVGLVTVPPLMLCALRFGFAALPAALVIRPPRAPAALVAAFGLALGIGQFGLLFTATTRPWTWSGGSRPISCCCRRSGPRPTRTR